MDDEPRADEPRADGLKTPAFAGAVVDKTKRGVIENLLVLKQTLESIKEREPLLREAEREYRRLKESQDDDRRSAAKLREVISQLSSYVYSGANDKKIDDEAMRTARGEARA